MDMKKAIITGFTYTVLAGLVLLLIERCFLGGEQRQEQDSEVPGLDAKEVVATPEEETAAAASSPELDDTHAPHEVASNAVPLSSVSDNASTPSDSATGVAPNKVQDQQRRREEEGRAWEAMQDQAGALIKEAGKIYSATTNRPALDDVILHATDALSIDNKNPVALKIIQEVIDVFIYECLQSGGYNNCRHSEMLNNLQDKSLPRQREAVSYLRQGELNSLEAIGKIVYLREAVVRLQHRHAVRLQIVVDQLPKGGVLVLENGVYTTKNHILIEEKEDVTLVGEGEVWVKALSERARVLTIQNSRNLTVRNVRMKHEVMTGCHDGVVLIRDSNGIVLEKSKFDGSGTYATEIYRSRNVLIVGGSAINNTTHVFRSHASSDVAFAFLEIKENGQAGGHEVLLLEMSDKVLFVGNSVHNNKLDRLTGERETFGVSIQENDISNNLWQRKSP